MNTNLNFFLCGWYKPVADIENKLSAGEIKSVVNALETVIDFRDTIASSWDYMSQANLNKFVTRIKRFFLLVFKLTVKYDLYSSGEVRLLGFSYDSKEKEFVLIRLDLSAERTYFMGRPAVRELAEIRQRHRKSTDMVAAEFREEKPAMKKKSSTRRKKTKRKTKPSASSRGKGVVEEISKTGVVQFKYIDCVKREVTVRRRIKLHLKVAFQPYLNDLDEGVRPVFDGTIDTMVSHALDLDDDDSVEFPIEHGDIKIVVFQFKR